MRIDILGLQAFIAISDHGSFQAAATTLHISQAALSHRIAKLEADLGVNLITRTTRNVALTPEGFALLPRVRRLLDGLQTTLTDIKLQGQLRQGKITLGCIPSIATNVLSVILKEFRAMGNDVRVEIMDGYATYIDDQVNSGRAEFGITVRSATHPELSFKPLAREPFVVLCRKDHELAERESVSVEELKQHTTIRNLVIADALIHSTVDLNWQYNAENVSTAIGMVGQGLGVTIVPSLGLRLDATSPLCTVKMIDPEIFRNLGIVTRPDIPLSPAGQELMRYAEKRISEFS
jgi:DNA-binding transcriptional LysR family regulator